MNQPLSWSEYCTHKLEPALAAIGFVLLLIGIRYLKRGTRCLKP